MSVKTLVISFLVLVVAVIGLVFIVSGKQTPPPAAASYDSSSQDRPRVEVGEKFADVGEIKVSDVITRDFPIKNIGTKPVQIQNINSSCGCTSGKIIYKDFTSKEFGMHAQSGFVTEIAPGDTATMRLTYRPATMPVYGSVTREVYLSTNDPDNSRLIFSLKAIVR